MWLIDILIVPKTLLEAMYTRRSDPTGICIQAVTALAYHPLLR